MTISTFHTLFLLAFCCFTVASSSRAEKRPAIKFPPAFSNSVWSSDLFSQTVNEVEFDIQYILDIDSDGNSVSHLRATNRITGNSFARTGRLVNVKNVGKSGTLAGELEWELGLEVKGVTGSRYLRRLKSREILEAICSANQFALFINTPNGSGTSKASVTLSRVMEKRRVDLPLTEKTDSSLVSMLSITKTIRYGSKGYVDWNEYFITLVDTKDDPFKFQLYALLSNLRNNETLMLPTAMLYRSGDIRVTLTAIGGTPKEVTGGNSLELRLPNGGGTYLIPLNWNGTTLTLAEHN